ncbi:MAG: hypothetical protein C0508_22450, partial [Cyanobacteria bacterium PR.023]|nr:hypothetical protein [Cyanobacteria bacterium PR.023]
MMRTIDTKKRKEESEVRLSKMIVSKTKLSARLNRMLVLIILAFGVFSAAIPAFGAPSFNPNPNNEAASGIEHD